MILFSSLWFRIFRMLLQFFSSWILLNFLKVNQMLKRGFSAIVAPSHRSDDDVDFAKPLSTKVPQAKRASSASSTASGPSTRKSMLPTNRTSSGKPPTIGCLNSWHILDSQEIFSICNQIKWYIMLTCTLFLVQLFCVKYSALCYDSHNI